MNRNQPRARHIARGVALCVCLAGGTPGAASQLEIAAKQEAFTAVLRQEGSRAFWDGPFFPPGPSRGLPPRGLISGIEGDPLLNQFLRGDYAESMCVQEVTCFDYTIKVEGSSGRLRVSFDAPWQGGTQADLVVYDPAGQRHQSAWINSFAGPVAPRSQEVFIGPVVAGTYLARVIIFQVAPKYGVQTRMRARLEPDGARPDSGQAKPLLPNLIPVPPFEFGEQPIESPRTGGIYTDSSSGCYGENEAASGHCLRFSFGWGNRGPGPLDLRFNFGSPEVAPDLDAPVSGRVVQYVEWSDGTRRPGRRTESGDFIVHPAHGHVHYKQYFGGRLYRVVDEKTGRLEPQAQTIAKIGGCSHDWKIVDWARFYQAVVGRDDSGPDCDNALRFDFRDSRIGLSAGHADVYGWGVEDNYVDLGPEPDGLWLLQFEVNPQRLIDEESYDDNLSFALVRVTNKIPVLEKRGLGAHPWTSHALLPLTY